ncbi:MAG TPA: hypothetical protein VEH83_05145 [Gemmatimonadales bacterium]|nr:hypothetical protein [Gemmatimonadales bacterium]
MPLNSRSTLAIRILVVAAVCLIAWAMMRVYTVGPSYAPYVAPAHAFLRATLARDSAALARQSAGPAAVQWALEAGRRDTVALRDLERDLYLGSGTRKGDSTVVWFSAPARGECVGWSLTLTFVGRGDSARIARASARCATPVTPPPGFSRTTRER